MMEKITVNISNVVVLDINEYNRILAEQALLKRRVEEFDNMVKIVERSWDPGKYDVEVDAKSFRDIVQKRLEEAGLTDRYTVTHERSWAWSLNVSWLDEIPKDMLAPVPIDEEENYGTEMIDTDENKKHEPLTAEEIHEVVEALNNDQIPF